MKEEDRLTYICAGRWPRRLIVTPKQSGDRAALMRTCVLDLVDRFEERKAIILLLPVI